METPSSAAAAPRELLALLQCHCGGSLGTAVESLTQTSSGQANSAVPARQPWMACISPFQVTSIYNNLIGFRICIALCACVQYKCSAVSSCACKCLTSCIRLQKIINLLYPCMTESKVPTMRGLPAERGCSDHGPNSYSVRLCHNTACTRILWNRDVNAAINILRLFLDWVDGRAKPLQFCRAVH